MNARRSPHPSARPRQRKGTLPLERSPASEIRSRHKGSGTLKMESEFTTITKTNLKRLQLMYPHGFDLDVFVANIKDAELVPQSPQHIRLHGYDRTVYRLYSVSHQCKESQQSLFSSIRWEEIDRSSIVGLMNDTERYYIVKEK